MIIKASKLFTLLFLCSASVSYAVTPALHGAGRRIPAPIFEEWGSHFTQKNPESKVTYDAVSAAEGLKQVMSGAADFGETDSALTAKDLEAKHLLQFPYMFSGITPVVNLPGFKSQLKLTGPVLADIFLGKVTKWNDPLIVELNPKQNLPAESIKVVHLVPDRGTIYSFTSYLTKVSPEWAKRIGASKSTKFPVGEKVENLYKMGDYVKATPYSIGVSENAYARKVGLMNIMLKNAAGYYVTANTGSIQAAASNMKWVEGHDADASFIDMPAPGSWPITEASYVLIKDTGSDLGKRKELFKYLVFGLSVGYFEVIGLDFYPVERPIYKLIRESVLSKSNEAHIVNAADGSQR